MIKDYCVACEKKIITKNSQNHYKIHGNYCISCDALAGKLTMTKSHLRSQLKKKMPDKKKIKKLTVKLNKLLGQAKYYTELNIEKLLFPA